MYNTSSRWPVWVRFEDLVHIKIVTGFCYHFSSFNGPVLEEGALAVMVKQQKLTPEFMVLCLKLVEQLKSLSNIQENVSGNKISIYGKIISVKSQH